MAKVNLGRVAFNRAKETYQDQDKRTWSDLSAIEQVSWQEAAKAVIEIVSDVICDEMKDNFDFGEK
jgi:hypothetical protein